MLAGNSAPDGCGLDFSRNILSNIEIHGEFAFSKDAAKKVISRDGGVSERQYDARSHLLGLRYLTRFDMTVIAEYYHNGSGYSEKEMGDYYAFIQSTYTMYTLSNDKSDLMKAMKITKDAMADPIPCEIIFTCV